MTRDDPLKTWKKDPHYRLLQAEIMALDRRLDHESELGQVVHSIWDEQRPSSDPSIDPTAEQRDQQHMAFYRKVLAQMLLGKFERIVTPDPLNETDSLGASLAQMNIFLDRKFAEVRAVSELARDIGSGLFIGDVMNHIFETFHIIIPFDQVSLALVERDDEGRQWVKSNWSRAMLPDASSTKVQMRAFPSDYSQLLESSSLHGVAKGAVPRIINDLQAYGESHPQSEATQLALKDGFLSNLTCPLIGQDGVFGFIFFASRKVGTYNEEHAGLFSAIAHPLTRTLEKCYLYEDLTIRNQFIRTVFGRYISDDIAEALLENPSALKMGGRMCTVTILMSDLRGFTKMSEHMKPEHVVTILNTCFNDMVRVIHKHNGTIDNIIGDAIMVLFGAPISRDDDALRAVRCALDMQAAMAGVNHKNARMGLPNLAMGIGINTGDVVAGNIGSVAHAKYSVIGAPVNLAARLESKALAGEVLVSSATYELVKDVIDVLDEREIEVKGFSVPVKSYAVGLPKRSGR